MDIQTSFEAGRLTVNLIGELDHHEARCAMYRIDELPCWVGAPGSRIRQGSRSA